MAGLLKGPAAPAPDRRASACTPAPDRWAPACTPAPDRRACGRAVAWCADDLFSGTEPIDNFFDDEEKANITARGKANVTGDDLGERPGRAAARASLCRQLSQRMADLYGTARCWQAWEGSGTKQPRPRSSSCPSFNESTARGGAPRLLAVPQRDVNPPWAAAPQLNPSPLCTPAGDLFSETEPIDNFFDEEEKANVTAKAESELGEPPVDHLCPQAVAAAAGPLPRRHTCRPTGRVVRDDRHRLDACLPASETGPPRQCVPGKAPTHGGQLLCLQVTCSARPSPSTTSSMTRRRPTSPRRPRTTWVSSSGQLCSGCQSSRARWLWIGACCCMPPNSSVANSAPPPFLCLQATCSPTPSPWTTS